jgi:hypothetical protein
MLQVEEHGCPHPPDCPVCFPILYELGVEAMKLGLVPVPKEITDIDKMPDEL